MISTLITKQNPSVRPKLNPFVRSTVSSSAKLQRIPSFRPKRSPLFRSKPHRLVDDYSSSDDLGDFMLGASKKERPSVHSDRGSFSEDPQFNERSRDGDGAHMSSLIDVLSRLDGRKTPRPGKFDVTSGRPLQTFLSEFENYCKHSFRGGSYLWASELEDFLTGILFDAYSALYCPGESYRELKGKLLGWYAEYKETIQEKTRKKFERAQMKPSESLRLYAARLEKQFTLAFPSKVVRESKTLQRKFLDTVPRGFKKHVFSIKSYMKMQGLELSWSSILPLASSYDAEHMAGDSSVDSGPEVTEVWASTASSSQISKSYNGGIPPYFQTTEGTHGQSSLSSGLGQMKDSSDQVPTTNTSHPRKTTMVADKTFESHSCHFCKRRGHIKQECRRYNKQCLACGSNDHMVSNCDLSFRSRSASRRNGMAPTHHGRDHSRRVAFEVPESRRAQEEENHYPENY